MTRSKLQLSLLILRVTVVAFFLVWAFEKILLPANALGVFEGFYFSSPPLIAIQVLGVVQALIALAALAGLYRFWTYGALLLMHAASTVASYSQLMNPYSGPNHLFWAAIPTLGALIALFLMRREDNMLTIGRR